MHRRPSKCVIVLPNATSPCAHRAPLPDRAVYLLVSVPLQALLDRLLDERLREEKTRKAILEQLTAVRAMLDYRGGKAVGEAMEELLKVRAPPTHEG